MLSGRLRGPRGNVLLLACVLAACGDDAAPVIPEFQADAAARFCPGHLQLSLIASESRSDPGWSGNAYGDGPPAGSFSDLEITSCDPECRRCRFQGPIRGPEPVTYQRCLNDIRIACEADGDCGTGPTARCRFMFPAFGGALASICTIVYSEPLPDGSPPTQGVIDLATGDVQFDVLNLHAGIAIGLCQSCIGDPNQFDGMSGGACEDTGDACDVAGTTVNPPLFTSFQCGPYDFTALDLPIPAGGASTIPKAWTLDDTRPACTKAPFTGQPCWCGVCEDTAEPCFADEQCASGHCGWPGPNPMMPIYNTAPFTCATTCDWDEASQSGHCLQSGGNDVGCLPDTGTIAVRGGAVVLADRYISTIGLLTCLPASGNGLIDAITGLPGPLYYNSSYEVRPLP